MELDDFRGSWKQPAPDSARPSTIDLQALLAQRSTTPVARMLRNARRESIVTAVSLGLGMLGLFFGGWLRPFWLLLLANSLVMGGYYYQKIEVLRRLSTVTGDLRGHMERQLVSMRSLLRQNYNFTMLTLLVTMNFMLYWAYTHAPHLFRAGSGSLWQRCIWLVLTVLTTWLVTHWTTKYHLQRLYGQHLDRLEASLRELDETQ